jgi:Tol biopolymer transport system component
MAASAASQRPAPLGSIVIVRSRDDTALFSTWLELRDLEAATGRSLTPRVGRGEHRRDDDPSFSPDGRLVAFYRVTPRVRGVFVVDADGTRLRRVFRSPTSPIFWSPTGDRLLFSVRDLPRQRRWVLFEASARAAPEAELPGSTRVVARRDAHPL